MVQGAEMCGCGDGGEWRLVLAWWVASSPADSQTNARSTTVIDGHNGHHHHRVHHRHHHHHHHNQPANQPTNQQTNRQTNQPTNQLTN